MMKTVKWKCTVCGEIVEGNNPPEKCPVCGVGPEYFIKIEDVEENGDLNSNDAFVIIGASGAGMSAAEEIRKRNKTCDITVISKEDVKGYYRPQLSKMLSSAINPESISIKDDIWLEENRINLMLDTEVIEIDSSNKKVILADGNDISYTKLIIASGAEVFVPPFIGRDKRGVFALRNLKDVNDIREYAKNKKTAAVIGGGVLGLETASELNNMGLSVTVLEMSDRILPKQLDKNGSLILEEIIYNAGVRFRKHASTKEITGDEHVDGVLLEDGEMIPADLVIISTGIKPNTQIVSSEIKVNRAIAVNSRMETSAADVYACGDCAEFNGINYALWSEAIVQGKCAGINAAGEKYEYEQIIPSTTLNAFNSSVFSIGDTVTYDNMEYDEYELKNAKNNNYVKMFFKNGILAGGILIGDTTKTVNLVEGFEKRKTKDEMIEEIK